MTLKRVALAVLTLSFLVTVAFAQTDQARLVGTVTDTQGAVVPGAIITVTSLGTSGERTATTNELGNFVITGLQPGMYKAVAKSSGLGPTEYSEIRLGVGQERNLNIVLKPAAVATEVTVMGGEVVTIDTSSARIGLNVARREVAELPLNGRQISQLYLMTPGATNAGSGSFDDIRFSGRATDQNAVRYDGVEGGGIVDSNPGNLNGETTSLFRLETSLENVQEFRIESNNYPAEYGTGTGGQISVITKSGTNQWHGSLFEYIRNNALDARNFFDGAVNSKLRLNQFGASVGGPVIKDKLFFYAGVEGLRQRTGAPIVESTLSAAARARAVPAIQPLLKAFPVGQIASSNADLDIVNVFAPGAVNETSGSIRVDYAPNGSNRFYARYFRDQGDSDQVQNSTLSRYLTTMVPQNGVLSWQKIYSGNIVNEAKFGYNAAKTRVAGVPGPSPDANINGVTLNLSGSVALSGLAGQAGSAGIAIPTGLIRLSSAFNGRGAPYTNWTFSFIDNLSIVQGSHTLKFGVEYRPLWMRNDQQGGTTYSFSNVTSFLANQPSSIQFLGDLSGTSPFTGLSGFAHLHQNYYIGYAQDEWKITPELTMNYGLRYEYYSPLHESRNKDVFFDISKGTIIPGYADDWYASSKLNFGPRLAFSYAPQALHGRTVFRIGSGFYYGPGQTEDQLQPEANDRLSTTISSGALLAYPLNTAAVVSAYNINSPTLGYQPRAYAPGYRIPERILSYTASIQQQLPAGTVLTVAYVGSQGRNLFLRSITNKITGVSTDPTTNAVTVTREFGPRFAEIDYKTSGGTSHYDALQSTLNRRFASGLTMGMQYTWSHDIGDSGGSNEARTAANNYSFAADRGQNNFDTRQTFNFSTLYELPYGKGRKFRSNAGALEDALFGGWQIGGIVNARTGLPVEVLITRPDVVCRVTASGAFVNMSGSNCPAGSLAVVNVPGGGNSRNIRRPDLIAGVDPYLHTSETSWINPAAFAIPQPGTFGNLSRNALHGPGIAQFDMTLDKRFHITEKTSIEFRAEFYNLFNKANFQAPSGGQPRFTNVLGTAAGNLQPGQPLTAAAAGSGFNLTSTVSNQVGLGTQRQIQFSLRLNF